MATWPRVFLAKKNCLGTTSLADGVGGGHGNSGRGSLGSDEAVGADSYATLWEINSIIAAKASPREITIEAATMAHLGGERLSRPAAHLSPLNIAHVTPARIRPGMRMPTSSGRTSFIGVSSNWTLLLNGPFSEAYTKMALYCSRRPRPLGGRQMADVAGLG